MSNTSKLTAVAASLALAGFAGSALADINVGITLCATGPGAALGIPEKNTVALLPTAIGGEKINYIVLDDGTDATTASKNARKLVTENNVDIIIGSSSVPPAMAVAEVANETKTPQLSLSPIDIAGDKNTWVFRSPQHNMVMAQALAEHMKANNVKTLGFIGYSDGYGESWLKEMTKAAEAAGIKMSAVERFNRTDTSVTGQALKLANAKPDAILVAASGTPSALPQLTLLDRGFKGQIYQTHGTATKEYIRVGGKAVDGTILPAGPVTVASQLPDSHPSKKVGIEYSKQYEEKYGQGSLSSFGAHMYDAYLLFASAAPVALKKAKPGTPEFRQALREALETNKEVVGTHGVFNMKPNDHFGHDARARVLVQVEKGDWKLLSDK
ncbi:ABC transporter substrate-binding protein [Noviherbaspirillum malthae]|uniref:ABC transporter substrate-binding protein n=1 Tax=Noviherbaspirillum malthae TaxID=1260987 RepID=UPI00188F50D8|nr:ABC transporter substrate-binding protein [Noviherbaspirillum malthae]